MLKQAYPQLDIQIETMKTIGDKIQDKAMDKIGDKGLFTKELETALADNMIDLVVHSLKDMPTQLPPNMQLACITKREDPRDCLIMKANHKYQRIQDLPAGSVIGTGSVRRVAQLQRLYPHLRFEGVRGNLGTRLAKLDAQDSQYDALILAVAGIKRVQMEDRITQILDDVFYAVGQGALGVEARCGDEEILQLISCLNEPKARTTCLAERELMRVLEGGCSVPIGVRSEWTHESQLHLHAIVVSPDGKQAVEAYGNADIGDLSNTDATDEKARNLGLHVAQLMREKGVDEILKNIH
ncbi:porphobilinogen deaminase [Coemansia brasiliensis]|uniref:hydroxymethylbilane synthase n=1 Tax=Coemansia brasiliensis TaxID=2650707 RepID=A0A9W8LZ87_9FUNG|nr:porphobilinogen deaminase [Coemansia brasiliensis]